MAVVWLNAVAPVRGALDANYVGYTNGFLHAEPGVDVTLLTSSLLISALTSALICARNRHGKAMLCVVATSGFFGWNSLLPLLDDFAGNPGEIEIELGEFLTIPYLVTIPLLVVVLVGPFAYGRSQGVDATHSLNRSAGVWKSRVFLGRSFSRRPVEVAALSSR